MQCFAAETHNSVAWCSHPCKSGSDAMHHLQIVSHNLSTLNTLLSQSESIHSLCSFPCGHKLSSPCDLSDHAAGGVRAAAATVRHPHTPPLQTMGEAMKGCIELIPGQLHYQLRAYKAFSGTHTVYGGTREVLLDMPQHDALGYTRCALLQYGLPLPPSLSRSALPSLLLFFISSSCSPPSRFTSPTSRVFPHPSHVDAHCLACVAGQSADV